MTDPEKTIPPESPTTRQEPDFDDDDNAQGSSNTAQNPDRSSSLPANQPKKVSFQEQQDEEAPPPRPARPLSPHAQAEATLIEAFPSIDTQVVKAVLMASGGQVEPAFNALLGMSDPSFQPEPAPPPQPARPQRRPQEPLTQLEKDEAYARQLAEQYNGAPEQQGGYGARGGARGGQQQTRVKGNQQPPHPDDEGGSFWDDDLPEIRKNLSKGFQETQKTVNKWILDFKKKIDGDDDEYDEHGNQIGGSSNVPQDHQRQDFGPSQEAQMRGIQRMGQQGQGRRSGDYQRYDADPQVLGDDFTRLQMEEEETPPRRPPRPSANPNLFKPTPAVPSGPIDEVDNLYNQPTPPAESAQTKAGKKWQPLTSIAPAPVGDDNDPFSLGDSDEEEARKTDLKPEDTERLKKSASVSEQGGGSSKAVLEEAGRQGTHDKEAEELLKAAEKK